MPDFNPLRSNNLVCKGIKIKMYEKLHDFGLLAIDKPFSPPGIHLASLTLLWGSDRVEQVDQKNTKKKERKEMLQRAAAK